ncbi:sulfite exporter TauE/SafE family protein [Metabacillus iocasae]|uniref:Probable membrane transporter protein n=1 Tax=Priestia iocasae TaxID=2291674 RepID=A0ABS2QWV6_9BACI|nr:sulfite exporter TauE/SafE family protein [Metabacillus iocasae]MBM7703959.1 putative membrane protein YfcA [Metabacillus iocasae]
MEFELMITVFGIGFIGSFLAGMLGIGGSVILYPLLLFVPPILGVGVFQAHDVAGIGAVQALSASVIGAFSYRKNGYLHLPLILCMGLSVLIGSLIGSTASFHVEERVINFIYAIMATIAAFLLLLPKTAEVENDQVTFSKPLAISLSLLVGIGGGIVGAGGAFLLVPIMISILHLPIRVTIASSLAITGISSIGTTIGKLTTGQILFLPALMIVLASILAAPLGAYIGQKTKTKSLQVILAVVIMVTSVKIWFDIFQKNVH